jgi:hypothetical protein
MGTSAHSDGMSDEAKNPEETLTFARILLAAAAVMLPVAIALHIWRPESGSLLEMLRSGLTTSGLIALTFGLMHLYRGRGARGR